MFGCRIILASCLGWVAMLAMPGAAQTAPVGGRAALETEKSAVFFERMRRDPADLTRLGLGQGQGLTTNRCVTVSPS